LIRDMGASVGKNERLDQATERPVTGKRARDNEASDLDLGFRLFPGHKGTLPFPLRANLWPI
jgi:hypothetical protein